MKKYAFIIFINLFSLTLNSQTIYFLPTQNENTINKFFIEEKEYNRYWCHIDAHNIEISGQYGSAPYPICVYISKTDEITPLENPNNILCVNYLNFIEYKDDLHNFAKYTMDNINFYINDLIELNDIYLNIICFSGNEIYLFNLKIDFYNFFMFYEMNLKFSPEITSMISINKQLINENNIYNINGIKLNNYSNNIFIQNNKKYLKK